MSKKKTVKASVRNDGWGNILTGLGKAKMDKMLSASIQYEPIEWDDAEDLYAQDDMAAKIVDELPAEAFREGFELSMADSDLAKLIMKDVDRLAGSARLQLSWQWARLYGGGAILIVTNEMDQMDKPLNLKTLQEIKCLTVLSAAELVGQNVDIDLTSPNFGFPRHYLISPRGMGNISGKNDLTRVHHTRLIRFDGVELSRRHFIERRYWGDSVLTRTYPLIRNYSIVNLAAANLMDDISIATYKVRNLQEALASGDDASILKRMQIVNLTRSIARAVVVDAEGEGFEYQSRSITGVTDLVKTVGNRLVAAADRIPHTRLLGESPDGSNATGNSTTTQWYDHVANKQEQYLKPRLMKLLTLLCSAKKGPTGGIIPDDLGVMFKPLWQTDEKEAATIRKTQADADAAYLDRGVLDPEEVAESRFGSGKFSVETKINEKLRKSPAMKPAKGASKPTGEEPDDDGRSG